MLNVIANAYFNVGLYDKALESYFSILQNEKNRNKAAVSATYNNIGLIFYSLGGYEKATEYIKISIEKLEKKRGDEHFNSRMLYRLCNLYVYYIQEKYDKLEELFEKIEQYENNLRKDDTYTYIYSEGVQLYFKVC